MDSCEARDRNETDKYLEEGRLRVCGRKVRALGQREVGAPSGHMREETVGERPGQCSDHAEAQQSAWGVANRANSPSTKRLPAPRPAAGKGLFLCVSSLVSLDMLHTPDIREQCKPMYQTERCGGFATYLKRLLQYLHGSALGFCWRVSPFSSTMDGGDASMD